MDEEDSGTSSRKRKGQSEDSLKEELKCAHNKIRELSELNAALNLKMTEIIQQSNTRIELLAKDNNSLRERLDNIMKYQQENVKEDQEVESSEEEEEVESDAEMSTENESVALKPNSSDNAENRETSKAEKPKTKNTKVAAEAVNATAGRAPLEPNVKRSKSIPVITTYNIDVKCTLDSIDKKLGHKNYNIKVLGKNVVNIGVCTLQDFENVQNLLKEMKIEFYTYTPKGRRPFTLVIEGLPDSFEPSEILEYLTGLQIHINVINIWKLGGDKWVVKLARESDIRKFYDIRYVLRCRVHIRKFRKKGVTQCFNCQRYGHVAMNCHMSYRCVKCGESHGPGNCKIPPKGENTQETFDTDPVTGAVTKRVGLPVKCANCNIVGHVASSKDCPRRVEFLRRQEEKRSLVVKPRSQTVGQIAREAGVSYASVARTAPSNGRSKDILTAAHTVAGRVGESGMSLGAAMAQYDDIDRDCKRFFGGGLIQCLGKIRKFSAEYKTLSSDEDKSRALLGMLILLGQDG